MILVAARGALVIAVERSHAACLWLHENKILNQVSSRVEIIRADARDISFFLIFHVVSFQHDMRGLPLSVSCHIVKR